MVEDIEELSVETQFYTLGYGKPFRQIKIAPGKVGTTERVAAEVAELTGLRTVAAIARTRAWIDGRDERIWVEPLHGARLGNAGNRLVLIERAGSNGRCNTI